MVGPSSPEEEPKKEEKKQEKDEDEPLEETTEGETEVKIIEDATAKEKFKFKKFKAKKQFNKYLNKIMEKDTPNENELRKFTNQSEGVEVVKNYLKTHEKDLTETEKKFLQATIKGRGIGSEGSLVGGKEKREIELDTNEDMSAWNLYQAEQKLDEVFGNFYDSESISSEKRNKIVALVGKAKEDGNPDIIGDYINEHVGELTPEERKYLTAAIDKINAQEEYEEYI